MVVCQIVERTCGAANSLHMAPTVGSNLRQSLVPLLKDLINPSDAFLLLLKGIILRKLRKRLGAMDCFIRSLLLFPYNWTAWLELNGVIETSAGELEEILPLLPKSFMRLFFVEHHYRQAEASRDPESNALRVERLLNIFPRNAGLWISLAVGRYMQQGQFSSNRLCRGDWQADWEPL
jgi:anaphase-promoting complex subunit 8